MNALIDYYIAIKNPKTINLPEDEKKVLRFLYFKTNERAAQYRHFKHIFGEMKNNVFTVTTNEPFDLRSPYANSKTHYKRNELVGAKYTFNIRE